MHRSVLIKISPLRCYSISALNFVPKHSLATEEDLTKLKNFIFKSNKILTLTGAGISTESGIPDYRSEEVGLYDRNGHRPVTHQEFIKSDKVRQRYWARNFVGWDKFCQSKPNITHYSIRNLEQDHGKISTIVTQNVDNLHFKAGSKNVIELHGNTYRVICLNCKLNFSRYYIQDKLKESNPEFFEVATTLRPDGDVDIAEEKLKDFNPPVCDNCGGDLKPDVIFFGDNVPRDRVNLINDYLSQSDSLLILGSSITVFSAYRIVLQALEWKKDIAIVNIGKTRADDKVNLKISARCGDILPKIC